MKRHAQIFAGIAALLLLTGCGSAAELPPPEEEIPAAAQGDASAAEETAPTETAPTEEETRRNMLDEEIDEEHGYHVDAMPEEVAYDTYEEFAEMLQTQHPDYYLYQLPEDSGFRYDSVMMVDDAFYRMSFVSDAGETVSMEMTCLSHYDSVEALRDYWGGSVKVEENTFEIAAPQYLFEHYAGGLVVLYGLTPEDNTFYTLMNVTENKPEDADAQEQALADFNRRLFPE